MSFKEDLEGVLNNMKNILASCDDLKCGHRKKNKAVKEVREQLSNIGNLSNLLGEGLMEKWKEGNDSEINWAAIYAAYGSVGAVLSKFREYLDSEMWDLKKSREVLDVIKEVEKE